MPLRLFSDGSKRPRSCIAHIFNHENDMYALADPGTCSQVHRVSRRSEYFHIRCMKEWVVRHGHKEQVCCTSYLTIQFPKPDASFHQTTLARHPVHPILVYGGSEREILLWNLSSPTVGTPTPSFPTAPSPSAPAVTTSPASHAAPELSAPAPQMPLHPTLSQTHDSKYLSPDIPTAWPPARLRIKRPHDPFLGARSIRRRCLHL
jgi:hypothetical protein